MADGHQSSLRVVSRCEAKGDANMRSWDAKSTMVAIAASLLSVVLNASIAYAQAGPQIITPRPGSTLPNSNVTFIWSANGTPVTAWRLFVGNAPGNYLYDDSGITTATSYTVLNVLPNTGIPIYVRLRYKVGANWFTADFQYRAYPGYDIPCPCFTLEQLDALYRQVVAASNLKVIQCQERDMSAQTSYPPYTNYSIEACVGDICDVNPTVIAGVSASLPGLTIYGWDSACYVKDLASNRTLLFDSNLNRREVEVCGNVLRASRWGQDVACGP